VALLGLTGCILLLPAAARRKSTAGVLLITVLLSLGASAAITGALSGPHDRYQSRLMWLPPFAAGLTLASRRSAGA
jgi:hypothetical protein